MITDTLLFLTGLIVGNMNAIAGGGNLIGFPALIAAGLSALSANATGYVVMLPGQLASAYGYRKYLRKVPKRYIWLLLPCAAGAAIGSLILRHTDSNHFIALVPWLILLAVGLFAMQPFLQSHLHHHITSHVKRIRPMIGFSLILLPLAIYGGYFGPGFGFVLLAFLSFTKLNQLHRMNGLKNIAATVMGITSVLVLSSGTFINWRLGLIMAVGSAIGGYSGSRLVQRVPSHLTRIAVIAIGVIAAAYLAFRSY